MLPDGRRALSGSYDKTLKLWDLASGCCLATFTGDAAIVSLAPPAIISSLPARRTAPCISWVWSRDRRNRALS